MEYTRWQKQPLIHALGSRRIVYLSGSRQCGKTTLIKQLSDDSKQYRTLDDPGLLKVALQDPHGFVKHAHGTMMIDEVQKAPDLIPAIKMVVDANNTPGQFLLTGSADVFSLPMVKESLAGRIARITLRPFSIGETLERSPHFLQSAFSQNWQNQIKGYDKQAVIALAFRGGFPEVLNLSFSERTAWHWDYVDVLLKRDLKDIANIRRTAQMRTLLEILFAWSGKFMNVATLCGQISLAKPTFETYVNLLESIYLFERVPAWFHTDYDRVGKRDKIYATDTGLLASILNWNFEDVLLDADRSGKIVETLVFNELRAQIDLERSYALFQYRDRLNHEIDFLVQNGDGTLLAIEVKAGSMVSRDDAKHIVWFREHIAAGKKVIGIVLYTGEHVLPLDDNIHAVPMAALWD